MTTIKLLSTGLIAIAMLTTTAVARENFAAGRTRVIIRGAPCYMGNSAPAGCWIVWHGIPIWFGPSVRGVPGNICDEGDNARICRDAEDRRRAASLTCSIIGLPRAWYSCGGTPNGRGVSVIS